MEYLVNGMKNVYFELHFVIKQFKAEWKLLESTSK